MRGWGRRSGGCWDMNKLDRFREARFQLLTRGDPCYLRGYPCVKRTANPSEVGPVVYISGRPYRIATILRRGLDEFQDGGVFYCYGYPVGPYRDRTPGCYLRKRRDGLHDPATIHVDDPHAFAVGHYIQRGGEADRIVGIRETPSKDTRFAYLRVVRDIPEGAVVHNLA